jgi:hypothetical protein
VHHRGWSKGEWDGNTTDAIAVGDGMGSRSHRILAKKKKRKKKKTSLEAAPGSACNIVNRDNNHRLPLLCVAVSSHWEQGQRRLASVDAGRALHAKCGTPRL